MAGDQAHARNEASEESVPGPRGPEAVESAPDTEPGRNPAELDQLIHGRVRLGIVSALAVHEALGFTELKEMLETSDGNLSAHARRLEEGGYLHCEKSFKGRVPHTEYRLTGRGRRALERYLDHMEALITRVRES